MSSDIGWCEAELFCDVGGDCAGVLFDLLFVIDVWVVGLGDFEELVGEVELIVVVVVAEGDFVDV